jgi:hypothetical protein
MKKRNLSIRPYEWSSLVVKKNKEDAKRKKKEGAKLKQDGTCLPISHLPQIILILSCVNYALRPVGQS